MTNNSTYTQVGLHLSLYSGKSRSYLLHKRIPFVERGTYPWELYGAIKRKTQSVAVPVVITPEGEYLQDTSVIIDTLEKRFPERSVLPNAETSPVLFFLAYAFELWGDEFWLPLAMHTRWSYPENRSLFVKDVGDAMMAGFPRWIGNFIGEHFAKKMKSYLPVLGVNDAQRPLMDRFLKLQLDALNTHFAEHLFLFGGRPSLADFGMIAPLYAHLGRDPWSKRELIATRPHLQAWIQRMYEPQSATGDYFDDDNIPATLNVALRSIFDEMPLFLEGCIEAVRREPLYTPGQTTRRFLGTIAFPFAGGRLERAALSYPVWMAERMQNAYANLSHEAQQKVTAWLQQQGGEKLLTLNAPKMHRIGLMAARLS